MWAMTRRGHVVEDKLSCERCLKVKRDLRKPPPKWSCDSGEEERKGWDEDMDFCERNHEAIASKRAILRSREIPRPDVKGLVEVP